jgi:hypothetical protein
MPLNQSAKFFASETLSVMEAAPEKAWGELAIEGDNADRESARRRLARTITALAAVGETDPTKLQTFALHAYRAQRVEPSAQT